TSFYPLLSYRYALKVYGFSCPSCGYESRHLVGTPDMDQILTDINTEFAQYRLFVCNKEHKLVHVDVLDGSFDGRCPSDGSELQETRPEVARCPRCRGDLKVQDIKPLSAGDSTSTE
ncbi:MAG: hypothetical protein ACREA4_04070, partial [Nitrososphaera sp.]